MTEQKDWRAADDYRVANLDTARPRWIVWRRTRPGADSWVAETAATSRRAPEGYCLWPATREGAERLLRAFLARRGLA